MSIIDKYGEGNKPIWVGTCEYVDSEDIFIICVTNENYKSSTWGETKYEAVTPEQFYKKWEIYRGNIKESTVLYSYKKDNIKEHLDYLNEEEVRVAFLILNSDEIKRKYLLPWREKIITEINKNGRM